MNDAVFVLKGFEYREIYGVNINYQLVEVNSLIF